MHFLEEHVRVELRNSHISSVSVEIRGGVRRNLIIDARGADACARGVARAQNSDGAIVLRPAEELTPIVSKCRVQLQADVVVVHAIPSKAVVRGAEDAPVASHVKNIGIHRVEHGLVHVDVHVERIVGRIKARVNLNPTSRSGPFPQLDSPYDHAVFVFGIYGKGQVVIALVVHGVEVRSALSDQGPAQAAVFRLINRAQGASSGDVQHENHILVGR